MSFWTLALTLSFVALAMLLSSWQKLKLERDMLIAVVRASIQLIAIGYILKFIFRVNNPIFTVTMLCVMIVVAAQNASRRGRGIKGVFWPVALAITCTEVITQFILLVFHVTPVKPMYIIPISGMIIGNSMVVAGLFINRFLSETNSRKPQVMVWLALGAKPRQAISTVLAEAVKASMIPTIDSAKTMGLVQLPGMMTGQIIAGADPIQAVRYQLLIVFAIIASAALTSLMLAIMLYPRLFNHRWQLQLPA